MYRVGPSVQASVGREQQLLKLQVRQLEADLHVTKQHNADLEKEIKRLSEITETAGRDMSLGKSRMLFLNHCS